jgi:hypothetical protein
VQASRASASILGCRARLSRSRAQDGPSPRSSTIVENDDPYTTTHVFARPLNLSRPRRPGRFDFLFWPSFCLLTLSLLATFSAATWRRSLPASTQTSTTYPPPSSLPIRLGHHRHYILDPALITTIYRPASNLASPSPCPRPHLDHHHRRRRRRPTRPHPSPASPILPGLVQYMAIAATSRLTRLA